MGCLLIVTFDQFNESLAEQKYSFLITNKTEQ